MNDDSTTMIIDDPLAPEALPPAPDPTSPDPSSPDAPPALAPFALVTVDINWPDEADRGFTLELPQPAVFQRLVRAEVASPILGGRRKAMMRSVWMVKADGPAARCQFIAQHVGELMGLPPDGGGPRLLGTVVDAFGNPIAVWQRTPWEVVPAEKEESVLHTG